MPDVVVAARCTALTRVYPSFAGPVNALTDVDMSVPRSAVTAIVGPSGSGKSTLLRILAALDKPTSGTVEIGGMRIERLSARRRRALRRSQISFMFPRPADNLLGYLDALEHVSLSAGLRGADEPPTPLAALGLEHRAHHRPAQLSGGEQQRLALAAAVVGSPTLVLADEPTAELDQASAHRLVDALHALARQGAALVVATHDPVVVEAADHVVRITDGRVT
jgi:putative ABC transport system ATP-binding protein